MNKIYNLVLGYVKREEERVLFHIGLVFLLAGFPLSLSILEISKAFFFLALLISAIRGKISFSLRKDYFLLIPLSFFLWTQISAFAHIGTDYFLNSMFKRNPIHFAIPMLAIYYLFNFKKDRYFVIVLLVGSLINDFVVLPYFLKTFERTGGVWGPSEVNTPAAIMPSVVFINLALFFSTRKNLFRAILALCLFINASTLIAMQSSMALFIFCLLFIPLFITLAPHRWANTVIFYTLFLMFMGLFLFQNSLLPSKAQSRAEMLVKTRAQGVSERTLFWQGSKEIAKKYPLFGVGSGNWKHYFYDKTDAGKVYQSKGFDKRYFHAHNNFFHVAAAYGIVGVALYILTLLSLFVGGYILITTTIHSPCRPLLFALYFSFLALTLQGITEYTVLGTTSGNLFWTGVGLFLGFFRKNPPKFKKQEQF